VGKRPAKGDDFMKMFDLTGKVAVVTGASSGLGVQFAEALAEAGADVAVLARREDRLEAVRDTILKMGRRSKAYRCDVSKEQDVVDAIAQVEADFGKIDILVNNAGIVIGGATDGYSAQDWDKVFSVDCRGVFLTSREALKGMLRRGYGKIVNVASVAGLLGMAGGASYNASKASVINLTRALAVEYAAKGVTVNAIAPGVFDSEMTQGFFNTEVTDAFAGRTPMARIGRRGELNGALIFLASDASSYVTGQTIAVDGGWTSQL